MDCNGVLTRCHRFEIPYHCITFLSLGPQNKEEAVHSPWYFVERWSSLHYQIQNMRMGESISYGVCKPWSVANWQLNWQPTSTLYSTHISWPEQKCLQLSNFSWTHFHQWVLILWVFSLTLANLHFQVFWFFPHNDSIISQWIHPFYCSPSHWPRTWLCVL